MIGGPEDGRSVGRQVGRSAGWEDGRIEGEAPIRLRLFVWGNRRGGGSPPRRLVPWTSAGVVESFMTTCKQDSVEAIRSVVIFLRGENLCETGKMIVEFLYNWVNSKSIRWKAKNHSNLVCLPVSCVPTPNRNPTPSVSSRTLGVSTRVLERWHKVRLDE
jgi:hypothetical protein